MRAGVDQAGVDVGRRRVDDLRPAGTATLAPTASIAVPDDDGAALDDRPGDGWIRALVIASTLAGAGWVARRARQRRGRSRPVPRPPGSVARPRAVRRRRRRFRTLARILRRSRPLAATFQLRPRQPRLLLLQLGEALLIAACGRSRRCRRCRCARRSRSELSGWWFQTTRSASLPTSIEPTRLVDARAASPG